MGLESSSLNKLIQPEQRLITLTGAGGKTSLSHWLGSLLKANRKRVITTTTTKILPPSRGHIVLKADGPDFINRVRTAFTAVSGITVARDYDPDSGKLLGISRETVSELLDAELADVILVEGDGAARKPLKAPAGHEPVIPVESDLCIGVMGIDAVYRTMSKGCVHRSEIFSAVSGTKTGDVIRPRHLIRLAESRMGLFKGSPAGCAKAVFLNKTDSPGGMELAAEFTRLLARTNWTATGSPDIKWFAGSVHNREIFTLPQIIPALSPEQIMQPAFS
ncbi:selenium cofactor biosynthesis protein YqeC [Desulfovibrio sp. JC022]|uniref:selenium cofactor biosynthesis protein YqeC n=1 Tax=Desulfovibrio sp. JC022 TaxID=2593642 RepID=UPI0013CFFEF0|nr:selenium cofactor biosynthesis protein YqeC [Desulfovibrio sp. JC022]NDV24297.1 putative selenium-dependent hydroxylase accessory protein YqeC [Desulfovibrio sp. JC022]